MKKALLLGAGFSHGFGMPLTLELSELFLRLFSEANLPRLAKIIASKDAFGPRRPINEKAISAGLDLLANPDSVGRNNYELLIARLQKIEGIEKPTLSDRDSYHYLFGFCYSIIHRILCLYQEVSYETIYPVNKQWYAEFNGLLSDDETWVFSLNHDLFVECLALDLNIPFSYGDTGSISFPVSNHRMHDIIEFGTYAPSELLRDKSNFFKGVHAINLIKLHGGISEFTYKDKKYCCNIKANKESSSDFMEDFMRMRQMAYYNFFRQVRGGGEQHRIVTNNAGELDIIVSSMLTGGVKYSKTIDPKEGEEKLQLFDKTLLQIDELTIVGYGFGDKHINARIIKALTLNSSLKLWIIDPHFKAVPECIEQFDYDNRIRRATCGAAEWMYYNKYKTWNSDQIAALKKSDRTTIKTQVLQKMNSI